jgi:formylglycine-generating enzyme required for sulfatase activity
MELVLEIKIDYPMKRNLPLSTCAIVAALITSASATVTMDWVTIGDINNAADTAFGYDSFGCGAVDHAYQIGKYEVTNAQYGEFLNAKGQSNSNGVYHDSMPSFGITQSGTSGSFSYTVTSAWANRPVVLVSWFDAARFANWMMNGQGNASMETGAYTLNNATSGIITANIGAQVYIPSDNEWYKAAYYNAANASYSLHSIYSDGDPSSYGTNDLGGNVWEWNDAVISGSWRGLRGDIWVYNVREDFPGSSVGPAGEDYDIGFRVASVVPEPTSILLSMFAGGMMLIRRKR